MPEPVQLLTGAGHTDARGTLRFVNGFQFPGVQRFYSMTHGDAAVVRAWQGHRIESKYFHVVRGRFVIAWVAIDDWQQPSARLKASSAVLSAEEPQVLCLPAGYANGIKALQPDASLLVFSNLSLPESEADRWSFDPGLWFDWDRLTPLF